jgi:hypothetical protein
MKTHSRQHEFTSKAYPSLCLLGPAVYSIWMKISFNNYHWLFETASKAIAHLKPGITVSPETALKDWKIIKLFAQSVPESVENLQFWSSWTKIHTFAALGFTLLWIRSQEKHSTIKNLLDIAAVSSLGLAVMLSYNTQVYATQFLRFCPKAKV